MMASAPARPTDGTNVRFGRARALALGPVRRGPREVLWTLPGLGLGNFLYLWLWTYGPGDRERLVLEQPEMGEWLDAFPAVKGLTVPRSAVRVTDRRVTGAFSKFGVQLDRAYLERFVEERLLTAPLFHDSGDETWRARVEREVVVHIRRGSYYDLPDLREHYSMNTVEYVRTGVERVLAKHPGLDTVRVISNDLPWARAHLGFLAEQAESVILGGTGGSAAEDFRDLSRARHLVLGNSTFSYWAGYISNVVHRDNHADIVAPLFHMRGVGDWRSWHLDPRWDVVEGLPGGWRDPEVPGGDD